MQALKSNAKGFEAVGASKCVRQAKAKRSSASRKAEQLSAKKISSSDRVKLPRRNVPREQQQLADRWPSDATGMYHSNNAIDDQFMISSSAIDIPRTAIFVRCMVYAISAAGSARSIKCVHHLWQASALHMHPFHNISVYLLQKGLAL
jgi:hypothetical protein